MKWTQFMDMHSGGGLKEPYQYIYIEAPEADAQIIFYNRFGHNPERVSCTCCGDDYSIDDSDSLEQATAYNRGCKWDDVNGGYLEEKDDRYSFSDKYTTLDEYMLKEDVLFIHADDIKPEEREGTIPEQGFIWHD